MGFNGQLPLRAGLIGVGMMGRHHARVLRSLQDVELVAVADAGGDPHGVAGGLPLYSTVEELIAHGIDYAMVAVPTIHHEEIGLALAAAGVHAMIEKPLAQDSAAALNEAAGFIRNGLFKRLSIHTVPTLHFHFDRTTERAADLSALIAKANATRAKED